ncbi:MAG: hypothetical protein DMD33_14135 [Gemmatimonadetes bacterium]|nr:MAG: hypothetical protein DMD33_14135 [Gemmatimonadota bacterium]
MASKEVDAAVGEAPARDALQILEAKRADLARAEQKLLAAQAAMDVDAEVVSRQRVTILREHVQRAEADAVPARDAQGAREATAWLERHHEALGPVGEKIAKVQARAVKLVEELVAAIKEEAALRSKVTDDQVRQEFLTLRWPSLAKANGKAPTLPPTVDYADPIWRTIANSDLLPRRGLRIMDLVQTQGGDMPEILRRKIWKGLTEFLTHPHNVAVLGEEVTAIVTRAGIPEWETAAERAARESRIAERKARTEKDGAGSMIGGGV